jgi:hypothetical protein
MASIVSGSDPAGQPEPSAGRWTDADERRHLDVARRGLVVVGVGRRSGHGRTGRDVRRVRAARPPLRLLGRSRTRGEPYLYVEELDGTGLRQGLEIKPPEMWAGHECDVPFRQWSLGNEAHGVLLDDPLEAWHRAHGALAPVTFDVEWYATAPATELDRAPSPGVDGYHQDGDVDVQIELTEGILSFHGPAERVHVWGAPYLPTSFAMPHDTRGLRAPYRRHDGILVDQVLATSPTRGSRWWVSR